MLAENEYVKRGRTGFCAKLRGYHPTKIGDNVNVLPGRMRDFHCVVSRLQPLRLLIDPMSHESHCDRAPQPRVSFSEIEHSDHPIIRVAQTIIRHMVADRARPRQIFPCSQDQYDDVPIGSRKRAAINIGKIDCVALTVRKRPVQQRRETKG